MKGSKYLNVVKKDHRYRIRTNPLYVLLSEQVVKGFEQQQDATEIETIINRELTEDFQIGGHPDFDYLLEEVSAQEDFDCCHESDIKLCSLFIDLRNFTKRALFIENPGFETIEEIGALKQSAISTWIKLARFYQGHIHSITGDGLMILFGGKRDEDIDEWTVGARAFLLALRVLESEKILNEKLKEKLKSKDLEKYILTNNLLDIKVGIEFSPKTHMNPQGVLVDTGSETKAVGEVKATAFEIDISAKLLQYYDAAKGQLQETPKLGRVLMLGERYIDLMNFDSDKVEVKKIDDYTRQMFSVEQSRSINYIDCQDYKDNIITIEDVARLCKVYDSSTEAKTAGVAVLKGDKIQHGTN